jgi:hypothetical protein
MLINVHNFTLTTNYTATIIVQSDSSTLHELPTTVIFALATAEALDLTGFEWNAAAMEAAPITVPGHTGYTIKMNKA